jgi:hypothetical protein
MNPARANVRVSVSVQVSLPASFYDDFPSKLYGIKFLPTPNIHTKVVMVMVGMRVRTQRGSSVPFAGLTSAAGAIHSCTEHSPLVVPVGVAVEGPFGEGFVTALEQLS